MCPRPPALPGLRGGSAEASPSTETAQLEPCEAPISSSHAIPGQTQPWSVSSLPGAWNGPEMVSPYLPGASAPWDLRPETDGPAGVRRLAQNGDEMKVQAAFFNERSQVDYVYARGRRERVAELTELFPRVVSSATFAEHVPALSELRVIFSTWGMPALTAEQLACLPRLELLLYAAGSVKSFARPFLEREIVVVSAAVANGVAVAEFTLGQILLSCKGFFRNTADCRSPTARRAGNVFRGNGGFEETVAIIGVGTIGRKVTELLSAFDLNVIVVDPYLPDQEAARLGVRKVTLQQAFGEAYVVSNHLPNLPELQGVLGASLFSVMRHGATFINTGRGAQVVEGELIDVLAARPDLTALLDVTLPEPPAADSALYTLPNVQLSSHIAGAMNNEVVRMADCVIEEFRNWEAGVPLRYAVSLDQLAIMA